jgi:hypothetical protein
MGLSGVGLFLEGQAQARILVLVLLLDLRRLDGALARLPEHSISLGPIKPSKASSTVRGTDLEHESPGSNAEFSPRHLLPRYPPKSLLKDCSKWLVKPLLSLRCALG